MAIGLTGVCAHVRAYAGALEVQTRRDPVDIQIREALSPTVDPIVAAFARTPATAGLLANLLGTGTPLVRGAPSTTPAFLACWCWLCGHGISMEPVCR